MNPDKPLFYQGYWWYISDDRTEFYCDINIDDIHFDITLGRTFKLFGQLPYIQISRVFDPESF